MAFRYFLIEIKKCVFSFVFVGSVLCIIFMCLCTEVYYDTETDRSYSVIECIWKNDRKLIESNFSFSAEIVFSNVFSNQYIKIFIPLLSSLPFIVVYNEELKSTFFRCEISRSSKYGMILSKFFGEMLCGGLVTFAGVLIYCIMVYMIFPDISSYELDQAVMEIFMPNERLPVVKQLTGYYIYGAFSAVMPFVVFEFSRSISVSESLSFMIVYVYYIVLNKLSFHIEEFDKYNFLYPHSIASIFTEKVNAMVIIMNVSFTLLCLFCFYLYKIRKSDISE